MNRNELIKTKCWSCWWREGSHCFSEKFGEIPKREGSTNTLQGFEITKEHIEKCINEYASKRSVLGSLIPNDKLIIASEF